MVEGVALLTIFVLSAFTGYEVIAKVSTLLHTPLMSGANAISGIILVGAVMVAGRTEGPLELGVALLAVALATVNLAGGFVVTDRMLQMFDKRKQAAVVADRRRRDLEGNRKDRAPAAKKTSTKGVKGRG